MGQAIGGILGLYVNGVQVPTRDALTYNDGQDMREGVMGHQRPTGYKEMAQQPFIECTISTSDPLLVRDLKATTSANVTARLRNGTTLVLTQAWAAGNWNVDASEGTVEARFEGITMEVLGA